MGILSAFRFAFQNLFFTPVLYGVIASLAVFSATWEKGDRVKDQISDHFRSQAEHFDFIVVGGGSAGAVVANRLSEFHSVLLLEAGGESHPFQAIPALSIFIPNYPATDWSHKSVTQTTSCLICVDKKYTFSQGKNLGGSGNLNYLIHLRGSPKDFDNWARITGDQRWSYEGVKPHFCNSEHFVGTTTDESAHGVNGPLQVEMPSEIGLANEWNWAGREMGYQHLDLNGRYDEGFDALYYPIKQGIRQATYKAYIQPVRERTSLLIRKFAHVNKVLIKEGSNIAYGVQYERHGKPYNAFANKEVILSAGTIQTPKILMLSGIGPRANLEHLHIPVQSDLPVGQNLHDHISVLLGPFFIDSPKTFSYDNDVTAKSFIQFTTQGKGPLTTSGFHATALVTSSYAKAQGQEGWPDIQLTLFGMTPHRLFAPDLAHAFGLREDILQRYYLHARHKNGFFIVVTVARPESRGDLCLKSTNPKAPLVINPNFFSDNGGKDIKVLIEGIRRALFIAENTTVFRNCDTKYSTKLFPGCEAHVFRSDAYWECYIRHFTITMNDQVGTCPMGFATSPYSVLDPELKVMGIDALRVIDASVMPTIVGANTQASTIMIAEKGASFILDKWKHDAQILPSDTPQYGPPPLPVPVRAAGDEPSATSSSNGDTNSNTKVPIDDFGELLQPPGLPPSTYENYDSFKTLLRENGLTQPSDLSNQVSPTSSFSDSPLSSLSRSPNSSPSGLVLNSPGPSSAPEVSTQLLPPVATAFNPNLPSDSPMQSSSTPSIYNTVYDPNFIQNLGSSLAPPTTLSTFSSTSQRGRAPKSFNGGAPQNVVEDSPSPNAPVESTSTSVSTSVSDDTSVLTRGPNGSVIIRRRKRPPNVTVHPRGHLGYEDGTRRPRNRFTGVKTTQITPSTSIIPLPKEVVTIRRRRPVAFTRRRLRTTTPLTLEDPITEVDISTDKAEVIEVTTNPDPESLPITTKRVGRGFVLTNSSRVSQSVSAVISRLRNFIPSNRNKRGQVSNTPSTSSRPSRSNSTSSRPLKSKSISSKLKSTSSRWKPAFKNLRIATRPTLPSIGEGDEEDSQSEEEDETEMIIFSDINLNSRWVGSVSNVEVGDEGEVGDQGGGGEKRGNHPYMPIDMNPVPNIIANPNKRRFVSTKERNQIFSKYKKAKRKLV